MGRKKKEKDIKVDPKSEETSKVQKRDVNDVLWQKAVDLVSSDYGDALIQNFEQFSTQSLEGISTGSLSLDYAINASLGGMPRGRTLELYGPFSGGKTTIALGLCANATANKLRVVFVDAEGSLMSDLVQRSGVNIDYFTYTSDPDGRKTANVVEALMKTGTVGVVVIDSVPSWKPIPEPKKGKEDVDISRAQVAYKSNFHSEVLPYLNSVARRYNVVLLLLNQVRQNIGGYGSGLKPFGGEALKHVNAVRVRCIGQASTAADRITDEEGNLVGQYTSCLVDKNKTAVPMKSVKIPLFLGIGVNPYMELAMLSQQVGIVEGTVGRFKWADTGDPIAHGINNFTQLLYDDVDLYRKLREQVIDKMGLVYPKDRKIVNAFHDEKLRRYK